MNWNNVLLVSKGFELDTFGVAVWRTDLYSMITFNPRTTQIIGADRTLITTLSKVLGQQATYFTTLLGSIGGKI